MQNSSCSLSMSSFLCSQLKEMFLFLKVKAIYVNIPLVRNMLYVCSSIFFFHYLSLVHFPQWLEEAFLHSLVDYNGIAITCWCTKISWIFFTLSNIVLFSSISFPCFMISTLLSLKLLVHLLSCVNVGNPDKYTVFWQHCKNCSHVNKNWWFLNFFFFQIVHMYVDS